MYSELKGRTDAGTDFVQRLGKGSAGGGFRHAVLDFDGTLSLVREGWQAIMVPYFASELHATPEGGKRAY